MKSRKNLKVKKQKKSMAPFVAGAAVGAAAGLLMAKKTGEELREDLGDNFETIKDKAKDMYDNKEEILENLERNIKKITKSEIKNFVEPEYYSKEFDLDDEEEDLEIRIHLGSDDEIEIIEERIKPIVEDEEN